ncbi:MAG: hypothetical protein BGO98_46960 [Myxococcales bacterium 68-20]|nr:MAG: hypothetical protein BGO98_46960 [Myxococcales bacterium 68-20]
MTVVGGCRADLVALVMVTLAASGCSSVFDDAACTLDERSYPIEVSRDVPFAFADAAKLVVEACATREGQTPTCTLAPAAPAAGDGFALGGSLEAISGSLTKTDDGNTRLSLTVNVGEGAPSSTTLVTVRVLDDAERELVKAEGPVRWSNDDCHPKPDTTKL